MLRGYQRILITTIATRNINVRFDCIFARQLRALGSSYSLLAATCLRNPLPNNNKLVYFFCAFTVVVLLGTHLVSSSLATFIESQQLHQHKQLPPTHYEQKMYYRARASAHKDFVDSLVDYGVINSKRVEEVLRKVDRGHYTPPGVDPYEDSPQTLGYGQTISGTSLTSG